MAAIFKETRARLFDLDETCILIVGALRQEEVAFEIGSKCQLSQYQIQMHAVVLHKVTRYELRVSFNHVLINLLPMFGIKQGKISGPQFGYVINAAPPALIQCGIYRRRLPMAAFGNTQRLS
ncbi:hypothetical protein IFT59_12795 [Rhizobium sp. CFBP 8752]|uniref:hypothetical protein n=1 Tax=Rhizobium sp. CFBP 8752 TaxID=2775301 RepID=UPI001780B812|nr:hypothetical protein [Rhizobium sp. CFBP 8752]MBD8664126.1 hypothetical protein [Rhizobium sp. CFBP 8752]